MRISVTGHRECQDSFDEILDIFKILLDRFKPEIVNTGMAIGFDQAVAISCVENCVPYKAFVPFKGQESKWLPNQKDVYHALMESAKDSEVVSSGDYAAWKMYARNARLVQEADLVIAFLDPKQTSGGTFGCVKLAKEKKIPVVNIFGLVWAYKEACKQGEEEKKQFVEKLISSANTNKGH